MGCLRVVSLGGLPYIEYTPSKHIPSLYIFDLIQIT